MIDEYSRDGLGWARLSDDRRMRYRLGSILHPGVLQYGGWKSDVRLDEKTTGWPEIARTVFVMINPSSADAIKPDPTWKRCIAFAQRWDAWIVEAVNLFAFRSPYPEDLKEIAVRGDDELADIQLVEACTGATRVIAAWGAHGTLNDRHLHVYRLLDRAGVKLWHMGLTTDGQPKHPLARGKHRIPDDIEPMPLEGELWTVAA